MTNYLTEHDWLKLVSIKLRSKFMNICFKSFHYIAKIFAMKQLFEPTSSQKTIQAATYYMVVTYR